MTTGNSQGANSIPTASGPGRTLTSEQIYTLNLGPNGDGKMEVVFSGTSAEAHISPIDSFLDCDAPTVVPQVCMMMDTTLLVQFEVMEDRGAVIGSATMSSHRCHGWVDTMRTTPVNKDLNGGRPF